MVQQGRYIPGISDKLELVVCSTSVLYPAFIEFGEKGVREFGRGAGGGQCTPLYSLISNQNLLFLSILNVSKITTKYKLCSSKRYLIEASRSGMSFPLLRTEWGFPVNLFFLHLIKMVPCSLYLFTFF